MAGGEGSWILAIQINEGAQQSESLLQSIEKMTQDCL